MLELSLLYSKVYIYCIFSRCIFIFFAVYSVVRVQKRCKTEEDKKGHTKEGGKPPITLAVQL